MHSKSKLLFNNWRNIRFRTVIDQLHSITWTGHWYVYMLRCLTLSSEAKTDVNLLTVSQQVTKVINYTWAARWAHAYCFSFFFWLRVLDKAEYSAIESTLNSPIVSYAVTCPACTSQNHVASTKGTVAVAPPPFRPGNPALCGSCPLVTPYYCRLGDLLCFVCLLCFSVNCLFYMLPQYFDTVGWVFWPAKTVARITYTVLVETLNPARSLVASTKGQRSKTEAQGRMAGQGSFKAVNNQSRAVSTTAVHRQHI